MTRLTRAPIRSVHRRSARREGAVMLVVLLVLMVATAAAMLALHTAQSELRATSHQRVALQTRGVSDAAMATTFAWIDQLGGSPQWFRTMTSWQTGTPPTMDPYPEPAILPNVTTSGFSTRTTMAAQRELNVVPANEVGPVCNPSDSGGSGGGGGSGGSGGSGGGSASYGCDAAFDANNAVGSFGPGQSYGLPTDVGYVVDLTDCLRAPATFTPGSPLGGGSSHEVVSFNCTVTARGRLEIAGAGTREWDYGATDTYTQRVFSSVHDSRATIVTPEMIVSRGGP